MAELAEAQKAVKALKEENETLKESVNLVMQEHASLKQALGFESGLPPAAGGGACLPGSGTATIHA